MVLIWGFILGTATWVLFDAKKIGARKGLTKGMSDMGPWGWFVGCVLLWIVAFPLYLIKRSDIKLAAGKALQKHVSHSEAHVKLGSADTIAQLEKLADLKSKGHLTEEEFNLKKKQLLAG